MVEMKDRDKPSWFAEEGGVLSVVAALMGLGALAALGQSLSIAFSGEEVCIDDGCNVVASLTRISPLTFNIGGSVLFAATAALALVARARRSPWLNILLRTFLASALAAEGVLFAYQWQVASTFCVYCLAICGILIAANVAHGFRTAMAGGGVFAASLLAFSILEFIPAGMTLDDGTFAVRECGEQSELYLLFSEQCPHCQNVVETLRQCDRCTVHFNPISRPPEDFLDELNHTADYDPRINAAAVRIMGFDTIPILMAREPAGLRLVRGQDAILSYVEQNCGHTDIEATPSPEEPWAPSSQDLPDDDDGGCSLDEETCE